MPPPERPTNHLSPTRPTLHSAAQSLRLALALLLTTNTYTKLANAQLTIPISPTSLEPLVTDNFLNATCLADANPGLGNGDSPLLVGDTVLVPLDCCGTDSFNCGGLFCVELAACAAVTTGSGTVAASQSVSVVAASVTGGATMTTEDGQTTGTGTDSTQVGSRTADIPSTMTSETPDIPTTTTTDSSGVVLPPPPPTDIPTTLVSTSTGADGIPTPVTVVAPPPQPTGSSNNDPTNTDSQPQPTGGSNNHPSNTNSNNDPTNTDSQPKPTGGSDNNPTNTDSQPQPTGGSDNDPSNPNPPNTDPQPQPTDPTQASSATTTPETSSSSSSSSSGTAQPTAFMLTTKPNTPRSDFDALIKTLPDQGEGSVIAYEHIPWQSYVTFNLTDEQATDLRNNAIVDMVGPIQEDDGEAGIIYSPTKPENKRTIQKREDSPRAGSGYHLGMLSAPVGLRDTEAWPDYEFDPLLGKGQWIYFIDTGYRKTHSEFAPAGRTVEEYVVPNEFTLEASPFVKPNDIRAPEDMTDHNGHGTKVASVAVGITLGVASQANFKAIKFRNAATDAIIGRTRIRGVTDAALRDAWDFAINDIITKKNGGDTGKFVINMSYGFPRSPDALKERIMNRVIPLAFENDITVVIAAGNLAPTSLDQVTPQNLGTPGNQLITVGGVNKDGVLFDLTNPDVGNGGSMTIYAAARDVKIATPDADDAFASADGTSLAAPAVAGLAAYFFGIPPLDALWPEGSVAQAMEEFLKFSCSVRRNSNPIPPELNYAPPSADSILVAWNRHPVGFGGCGRDAKVKRQNSGFTGGDLACPISVSLDPNDPISTGKPGTNHIPIPIRTTPEPLPTILEPCTVFVDGSACALSPGVTCPFPFESIVCPTTSLGARAVTDITHYMATTIATVAAVATAA